MFPIRSGATVSIALVSAFPLSAACQNPQEASRSSAFFDHSGFEVSYLQGELLSGAPVIRKPTGIRLIGDQLWVLDSAGDPWVHLLDEKTGNLVYSGGRRGEGLGDFVQLGSLGVVPPLGDRLWAFDGSLARITVFSVLDGDTLPRISIDTIPLLGAPVSRALWLDGERILGMFSAVDQRFSTFTVQGKVVQVQRGPLLGEDLIPLRQRVRASYILISLCNRRDTEGFVIAYGTAGRIEIYDGSSQLNGTAFVPYPSSAFFEPDTAGGPLVYRHRRTWYTGCVGTQRSLYALFSGRASGRFDSVEERDSGEFVHVFGWDGELRKILRLDHPVRGIDVSVEKKALYAVSMLDGHVYKYQLPADLFSGDRDD